MGTMDPPRTWTFAMVDLAGFTALTESHGDDLAADLATTFADLAAQHLGPGDRLVKTLGDAVLLAALEPAAGLHLVRRLLDSCYAIPDFPIARAGIHHGPAVERGGDLFGAAVNLTARVAAQAAGGQTLATGGVAHAATELGMETVALGRFEMRNVGEPVDLWEIALGPSRSGTAIDPVCRMQVEQTRTSDHLRHDGSDYWFCSLACAGQFAADPERFVAPPST